LNESALQAVIDAVRSAADRRAPLRIVGGGTKDFYGGGDATTRRGEVLDVKPLAGISAYEPTELVVTVRAGTPLTELEAALAEKGQCLPFEPPRFVGTAGGRGTVGGMVAAGLAGPSRASVGAVRDYVLGASLLNGRAEVLSFGGQVMKNVAGYDVARLLAGSLGVLGVICEVSLKVLPIAPAEATLRFEMDEATALSQLNEWGGQPLPINASAWWAGTLLVRLRGARAAVDAACSNLGGERIDDAMARTFWDGLRDQRDEFFVRAHRAIRHGEGEGAAPASGGTLWRVSVAQTAAMMPLPGEQLIEWGGAQRWWVTSAPASVVREMARERGGHATRWYGADATSPAFTPLAEPIARIHRGLKQAFDPAGIFNPGRLVPGL